MAGLCFLPFCLWMPAWLPHALLVSLWYYLWIAPKLLLLILGSLMYRRGLHREFPVFFVYLAFQVLQSAVLWAHPVFDDTYMRLFSGGVAVSSALRFGVIYEVFRHLFRSYPTLTETGIMLFRGVTLLLLVAGVALAALVPGRSVNTLMLGTNTLDRTVSLLQCGLLLFLFAFSRYFALSLKSRAFGIALGLGSYASVQLAISAVLLYLGSGRSPIVNLLSMATYHCCLVVWMFYMLTPERKPSISVMKLPAHDLDMWNRELQRLLQQQ